MDRDTQGKCHVTMEAEIEVMPQAKKRQPARTRKKQRRILPYRFQMEYVLANTLILDF